MLKSVLAKALRVGRATALTLGVAMMLALTVGIASTAVGANGKPFLLGRFNVASAASTLVKQGFGPALNLKVRAGQPPMTVNSSGKVANLNADKLDGKSVEQIGVNGVELTSGTSAFNSDSPKSTSATCPAGKVVLGTGYDIVGGKSGTSPNALSEVVVDEITLGTTFVFLEAFETDSITTNWDVSVTAICATAP